MNREEIIIQIQDKLNKAYMLKDREEADRIIKSIFDDVDKLRQPITLAEFLGWEEDTEYKYMGNIYKVKDDTLYRFSYKKNRFNVESNLRICSSDFAKLKQAIKIEKKYHIYLKKEIAYALSMYADYLSFTSKKGNLLDKDRNSKEFTKKEFEEIKKIADIFELEE